MPAKNHDLHGNVPDTASAALLIIDLISDFEFEHGAVLFEQARRTAEPILALKRRCHAAGIPTIYVNDNFGKWRSNFQHQVQHCLESGVRGEPLVRLLAPAEDDYFVLKPKHSGFFSTTLELLLEYLGARTLILTGVAGNMCVLFTAHDAYMRDFHLVAPADCIASADQEANRQALAHMAQMLKADIRPASALDLAALTRQPPQN